MKKFILVWCVIFSVALVANAMATDQSGIRKVDTIDKDAGIIEQKAVNEDAPEHNLPALTETRVINKPASAGPAAVPDPEIFLVGGDTIEDAVAITELPYNDTGNTCGFVNDYDEVCPYSGGTAPDVVYSYTPGADITVDIDLCNGSAYDTKLYVYENEHTPDNPYACNDDACPGYVSQIMGLALTGGNTYYIVVDGYGTDCGDYILDVTEAVTYPPPENDDCETAEYLGGTYPVSGSGTTYGATVDCEGVLDWNGVWYSFDLPYESNDINIQICGVDADLYNVGIVLMDDCLCDDYVLRDFGEFIYDVCPGDWTGYDMTFLGMAGPATIYWPALAEQAGYNPMDFDFTIDVTEAAGPEPGDDCDNPIVVNIPADLPFEDFGQTNCGRGNDYMETCLGSYDGGEDITYELVVTEEITLDLAMDPLGTTWTGMLLADVCPGDVCIDYDTGSSGVRTIDNATLAAGTYYVMIDTWPSPNCIPEFDFTITEDIYIPPPENDSCENATPVGEVVDLPFSTNLATASGLGTCMTSPDIWYVYTPTETGPISISLCGSEYDTKLAVYDGYSCDPLPEELGCNDDYDCPTRSLQSQIDLAEVIAGNEYLIQVGGYSSNTGDGILNIFVPEPPPPPACCQDVTPPEESWTFATSDVEVGPYTVFDDFLCEDITGHVQFWGVDLMFDNGWYECTESPMDFEIIFYEPGIEPGPVVATYNVTAETYHTGIMYGDVYELVEYDADLSPAVEITEGWISIQGTSAYGDSCVFLWGNSFEGNEFAYQDQGGVLVPLAYDLARCLTPPALPDITIGMDPVNPPVEVPPGGSFDYIGSLTNNTGGDLYVDVWIIIEQVGVGQKHWRKWLDVLVVAGATQEYEITQLVPEWAGYGDHIIYAYCGTFDTDVIDWTSFDFVVVEGIGGGAQDWSSRGGWSGDADVLPSEFALGNSYPNPFNAQTNVTFELPQAADISLDVYNLMGQKVATLAKGMTEAGYHTVTWDASENASGIYFYKLTAGDKVFSKRLTLIK